MKRQKTKYFLYLLLFIQDIMEVLNSSKAHIFLSYSRKDKIYVDAFIAHLDILNAYEERFSKFVDRKDIELNERWRDSIIQNIMVADFFIIFISSDALNSKHVKEEIDLALNRRKREKEFIIIPFLIRECYWVEHPISEFPVFPRDQPVTYVADASSPDAALTELVRFINDHAKKQKLISIHQDLDQTDLPRKWEKSEKVLEDLNGIYYKIEKSLSLNMKFWKNNPPKPQDSGKIFGSIFFSRQVEELKKVHKGLSLFSSDDAFFSDRVNQFIPIIEDVVENCRLLIETSEIEEIPLFSILCETENYIEKTKENLLAPSDNKEIKELKGRNVPTLKHCLSQLIQYMNEIKSDFKT
ncbi:MAG: toll/interleukin-1 receptor domain-containing protein [Saprospiraceae bacterium]|nr:toll/interleukin-1 receptor domain-containing protein [Saprospiraceae bacterium]